MRILHLMLACFYIDNYNYQENILPRINKQDGHDVKIIASVEMFIDNESIGCVEPGRYVNEDGIEVVRLPYKKNITNFLARKRRSYVGLMNEIISFGPDVIMCHGMQFEDLNTVGLYKRKNPKVRIYVDCHEDYYNSATSFLSKYILHKSFYVPILRRNLKFIDKILCIAKTSMDFATDFYKIPLCMIEFYPLGGIINTDKEYYTKRKTFRRKLKCYNDEVVILHSGKLDKGKRTKELISAFSSVDDDNLRLVIIGSIPVENQTIIDMISYDPRIEYLGWKSGEELMCYLCASDIYAQPGTQSATLQNAACARNAIMVYPHSSYEYIFDDKALYVKTERDIKEHLKEISKKREYLDKIKSECYSIAKEKLDYERLAKRIYD